MIAIHGQLPDYKLAVYVQGNLDHAELRHALMYRAFDQFALGLDRDWSTEYLKLYGTLKRKGRAAARKADSTGVKQTEPSLPLTAYTGAYTDSLAGRVVATMRNNELYLSANTMTNARLHHWNFDTFQTSYEDAWLDKDLILFGLDDRGKVKWLNWNGIEFITSASH